MLVSSQEEVHFSELVSSSRNFSGKKKADLSNMKSYETVMRKLVNLHKFLMK